MENYSNQEPPELHPQLKCSSCGLEVEHGHARKCPRCAELLFEADRKLAREKSRETKINLAALMAILVAGFLLVRIMGLDAFSPEESSPEKRHVPKTNAQDQYEGIYSLEYKLATINARGFIEKDNVTVYRFRFLLDSLATKTTDERQNLADVSVKSVQILKEQYGKDVGLLEFMEGMNKMIPSGMKDVDPSLGYTDYAKYASLYVLLLGNQ